MSPRPRFTSASPRPTSLLPLAFIAVCLTLLPTSSAAQTGAALAIREILLVPAVARPGDVVTARVTVENVGSADAASRPVGLYLGSRSSASVDTATALGALTVDHLAPGASVQLTLSFTVPEVSRGTHYVIAHAAGTGADGRPSAGHRAASRLEVTRPDLVVAGLALSPGTARAGEAVDVIVTVRNAGRVPSDASHVAVYLAPSDGASVDDATRMAWLPVEPLAAGGSIQLSQAFSVPAFPPGRRYAIAKVNADGTVRETSHDNNRRTASFWVAAPDLVVSTLQLGRTTARPGETISVRVRVRNQGRLPAEASEGAIYFVASPGSALDGAGPILTFAVPSLMPSTSVETRLSLTLPSVAPGSFTMVARADSTGLVAEGSESNNLRSVGVRVAISNLVITAFTATPSRVGVGETLSGTVRLRNSGPVASPPTTAALFLAPAPDTDLATALHVATVSARAISSGGSTTLTVPVPVPDLPEGNHYLIVHVAAESPGSLPGAMQASVAPAGAARPASPRSAARFTLGYPDLVVTGLVASPAQVRSGDGVVVNVTVRNESDVPAPGSTAAIFLAPSGTPGPGAHAPIATVSVGQLARRSSATLSVRVPVTVQLPGAYALIVEADWPRTVAESNDGNNRAVAQVEVAAPPGSGGLVDLEPQVDPSQLDMPWPKHSHYKHPWKAWLETVPAQTFRTGVGIGYNWHADRANDAVEMRLLATAGISRIRFEVGWNDIDFDTLDLIPSAHAKLTAIARAAQAAGIRPLILLNANHGAPGPSRELPRIVAASAPRGARSVRLTDVTGLRPSYTGLSHLTDYKMAEVLVTAVDPATRTATLSKPLPVTLSVGQPVELHTLRYQPLSEPGTAAFEETVAGWLQYARAVLSTVRAAGVQEFDVEIWNELTFGSDFLSINHYYDPPLVPDRGYLGPGERAWELARRTVAMMAAEFPLALPIWGFSNVTFFGVPISDLPAGTRGQSYHPYFFSYYQSFADEQYGFEHNLEGFAPPAPPYRALMPEGGAMYLKTESLARLLHPDVRPARPPGSPAFDHFMTEFGFSPAEFGVTGPAAQVAKAKTLLRASLFWLNKGLTALWFFSDFNDGNLAGYDLFPSSVAALADHPADPEPLLTLPLRALRTVSRLFAGAAEPLSAPRQLAIAAAAADGAGGGLIFAGDATHPSLTYQDALATLPFQLDARTFAVAFYVMSRDILAPLPDTPFLVQLSNVRGTSVHLRYVNPLTDTDLPVEILARSSDSLLVRLPVSDTPCLLLLSED